MPNPVSNSQDVQPVTTRRRVHWDGWAAIIASLVGLLALLVAAYTAYIQRQQTRAQVWPYLQILSSDLLPSNYVKGSEGGLILGKGGRFMVTNKGVGPAIIERVEVEIDGKPQSDWVDVMNAFGVHDQSSRIVFMFGDQVLSPNETINVFAVPDQQAWKRITSGMQSGTHGVVIKACYRSTLGEYWLASTHFSKIRPQTRPVHDCRVIPEADEFNR